MAIRSKPSLAISAVLTLAAVVSTAVPAVAAQATGSGEAENYCAVVLGKSADPDTPSPELYRHCSATPFDMDGHIRAETARGAGLAKAASATPLIRLYEHNRWEGKQWTYYGSDGPCDHAGYLWRTTDYWGTHLSSIMKVSGSNCDQSSLSNFGHTYFGYYALPFDQLPPELNDKVDYVRFWHG